MAILRDHPYGNARFRVEIDGMADAEFAEVCLPVLSESVVEYRDGHDPDAASRRLPGRPQVGPLVLRRGFRGSLTLYRWWREVADGQPGARRDAIVHLLDEGAAAVVATWRLRAAWPARYALSPLEARGCGVVIEEVELVGERFEME